MWRLVAGLRPLGWLGVLIVALGILITFVGGVIMLRNRRVDED
jgi:hypothetical protein